MTTRAHLDYAARRSSTATAGHDPDQPVAGFYRMRLRSGGITVGVRLWFGAPREPWTGDEMDRAPRWNASINGEWAEVADVWPRCAGEPIDEAEHDHLAGLQRWGRENDVPAIADPRQRLDPLTSPLLF